MTKDLTFTIETPALFLQATYECTISRGKKDSDYADSWWEPDIEATLIRVDMTNHRDEEFEWFYGDQKPGPIERALELHTQDLDRLLYEKAREFVNNPNFEDPHEH
jgi:hypothetical protein